MAHQLKISLSLAAALALAAGAVMAQPDQKSDRGGGGARPAQNGGGARPAQNGGGGRPAAAAPRQGEPHAGPSGYQRPMPPKGWNARPAAASPPAYQHNYQAARTYKIGPYHPPAGWAARRWTYGQILPRAYWTSQYLLADYWLFGLEVPPVGYEWVRDGNDALLVSVDTGQILQAEYGAFG